MKKNVKILTMLLAAVLVGLLLVTACTNPTNGDPGAQGEKGSQGAAGGAGEKGDQGEQGEQGEAGGTGAEGKPGLNVATIAAGLANPDLIAAYFANLVDTVVVVADTNPLEAGEYVIPANKTLVIAGAVAMDTGTSLFNALDGTLNLDNGSINGGSGTVTVLVKNNAAYSTVTQIISCGTPTYYNTLSDASGTGDIALPSLTIDAGTTWASLSGYSSIHINGDLIIKTGTLNPSTPSVAVYGNVKAEGVVTLATTGWKPGTIAKPGKLIATGALDVHGLNTYTGVLDTSTSSVVTDLDSLTAIALDRLDGNGTLVLDGALVNVNIGVGGTGKVRVTGIPVFTSATANIIFGNSGLTTFVNDTTMSVDGYPITFGGPVSFAGSLTLVDKAATFGGTASFAFGKVITLTAANDSSITLNKGAALALNGNPILIADANTTLTPGAATLLSFHTTDRKITQSVQSIAITGSVTVAKDATYDAGAALTVAAGGTLAVNGTLNVLDDLVLTSATTNGGAILKGTGTGPVVAGDITITGAWQAVDDSGNHTITISSNSINGSNTDAALTATATTALITVPAGKTLALSGTTVIDLQGNDTASVGGIELNGTGGLSIGSGGTIKANTGTTGGYTANIGFITVKTDVAYTSTLAGNKLRTIISSGTGVVSGTTGGIINSLTPVAN